MEQFLNNKRDVVVLEEPVEIHLPIQKESYENFQKIQLLEKAIEDLDKRLTSVHELVSRLVEMNVLLRRQQVPTYDPEIPELNVSIATNNNTNNNNNDSSSNVTKHVVTLLKSNDNKLVIKGKTFDIKDQLKSRFGAQWNMTLKCWTCDVSHESSLKQFLVDSNFEVA
jgi:hypothetical protein